MDKKGLQTALKLRGNYHYKIDGDLGNMSRAAMMDAVTEGADRKLSDNVIELVAKGNDLEPAKIRAVWEVEAGGGGFANGRSIILPEPHRFSKATGGRFDASNPTLSYPKWDRTKYPKTQDARWGQLINMVCLDVDAGWGSASYGAFQIMGENYALCGFDNAFNFMMAMTLSEDAQLEAFIAFIISKRINGRSLLYWLQTGRYDYFAEGYNGTAYRVNQYDTKIANAVRKHTK